MTVVKKYDFERLPLETDKAYAAFTVYLNLGAQRSTQAVANKLGKCAQLIRRWSSQWRWSERVAAHGAHLATIERETAEVLARSKAVGWVKRQQELRETEWQVHLECVAAARRGLESFMARPKAYATLAEIARLLELASKLGRLASGLPTDHTELTGEDGGPLRVELTAALNKIYGQPGPGEVVDVETVPAARPALPEPSA